MDRILTALLLLLPALALAGQTVHTGDLDVLAGGVKLNSVTRIENDGDMIGKSLTLVTPLAVAYGGTGTSTAFTAGSVVFAGGSGVYAQDNAGLFWDSASNFLGVGTASPSTSLHAFGNGATLRVQDNDSASAYMEWVDNSRTQTIFRKVVDTGAPIVDINLVPSDGASNATLRFFRETNTSGAKTVQFLQGNNTATVNAQIGVGGAASYVGVSAGGSFGVGIGSPGTALHVRGDSYRMRLDDTSIGDSAVSQTMPGLELMSGGMNGTTSRFGAALKFGSTDAQFTTTSPKFSAIIVGEATETYAADTDAGMGLGFYTTPDNAGAAPTPTQRMFISQDGNVNIVSGLLSFGGNTAIDASRNYTGASGTFSGALTVTGNTTLGGGDTASIDPNGDFIDDIEPDSTLTYNLGSTSKVWNNIYAANFYNSSMQTIGTNSNGVLTFPNQPRAKAYRYDINPADYQSIASGSQTTVNFNNEEFDVQGYHDLVTDQFIPTIAGLYLVCAAVTFEGNATGRRAIYVSVNGNIILQGQNLPAAVTDPVTVNVAGIISLSALSVASIVVFQDSGSALDLISDTSDGDRVWVTYYKLA